MDCAGSQTWGILLSLFVCSYGAPSYVKCPMGSGGLAA